MTRQECRWWSFARSALIRKASLNQHGSVQSALVSVRSSEAHQLHRRGNNIAYFSVCGLCLLYFYLTASASGGADLDANWDLYLRCADTPIA